jgi:hypothetical protein
MLKTSLDSDLFYFGDLNPSVIGHEIRWVAENPTNDPMAEKGLSFTVVAYEEQTETMDTQDHILPRRLMLRITTELGEQVLMDPSEKFTTNFHRSILVSERFAPDMNLGEYTFSFVGSKIVGNNAMIVTGSDSNHAWGHYITGKVISYKRSGARLMYPISSQSVPYEVTIQGLKRPIVVDSESSFWA